MSVALFAIVGALLGIALARYVDHGPDAVDYIMFGLGGTVLGSLLGVLFYITHWIIF